MRIAASRIAAMLVLGLVVAGNPTPFASVVGIQLLGQEQTAPAPPGASVTTWHGEISTSIRAPFARLLRSFTSVVPRLLAAGVTVLVFWAVARLVRRLAYAVGRVVPDPTLQNLLVQFAYYSVWMIGAIVALDSLGFDPQAVVTGLGLTSIALGFALKDVLSNLVSGLLLLVTRSFEIGDQIIVGETEGTVERIEVRVTQIRTYDGRLVLVPNAEVFTSRVVNNTASPLRRASIIVPLGYQEDLGVALRTIEEATHATSGVAADPAPSVRLRDFTPDHLAVEARFWTDARRSDFMNTSCRVREAILHGLNEAGVALPNPGVQTVAPGNVEGWRTVFGSNAKAQTQP